MMKILLAANMSLFGVSPQMLTSLCLFSIGAVHKVCHAIFGQFLPLLPPVTLCHTSRDPPKVCHTSRTPPPIFSRPSTRNPDKILSQMFMGVLSGGLLFGRFCPLWFLSVPSFVRMHLLQQKFKHHFE